MSTCVLPDIRGYTVEIDPDAVSDVRIGAVDCGFSMQVMTIVEVRSGPPVMCCLPPQRVRELLRDCKGDC